MAIHKEMEGDRLKDNLLEAQILDAKIKKGNAKVMEL